MEVIEIIPAEVTKARDGFVSQLQELSRLMNEPDKDKIHKTVEMLISAIDEAKEVGVLLPGEEQLEHIYTNGLYGRKWSCPAGRICVTLIHRQPNISSLIKGKIVVATDEGYTIMEAPQFFVTEPGTQRVILTITDTVFTTVHLNTDNEKDLDVLEKRLTFKTFEQFAGELR